jgi:predicted N-acetyltransferase YhbS
MPLPTVRPMTPADVERAAESIARGDWGDRRVNLAFVTSHPATRPFVADADGEIVGTGVAMLNGSVGWIGTIWVDRAWRRRGIGLELTRATVDAAESAGCRTLVLVATEAGQPMYERLGFEVQTWYRIVEAPGLEPIDPDPRIRPYRPGDMAAMSALDSAATGEDRAHLLEAFAAPETARCLEREDGTLGAFVVRAPWGGGATIAPDVDDAAAILRARRLAAGPDGRVRAGILVENDAGLEHLARAGWAEVWRAPRLVRGDPLRWRPEAIWGQFNHAMG